MSTIESDRILFLTTKRERYTPATILRLVCNRIGVNAVLDERIRDVQTTPRVYTRDVYNADFSRKDSPRHMNGSPAASIPRLY